MTTATLSKSELNGIDFDALERAEVMPDNKKQIIIDYINANGLPKEADRNFNLFQKNGMFIQDSFENYLSSQSFYSTGSFAKLANGTPLDFLYDTTDGLKAELDKFKDKSAFELGTFTHEAILEPAKWGSVVCEPKASRTSHEGLDTLINFWEGEAMAARSASIDGMKTDAKKEYINTLIAASGKKCIDFKNALIVQRVHEQWKAYQGGLWYNILTAAIREVSMYSDDYNGLPMRIRPDGLLFDDQIGVNAVVSVKTTSEKSVSGFARQCRQYGYDIKEAAYQRIASHVTGLDFSTTIMIVLSTAEPFHVGVFILNDNEMKFANERFETAIELAKVCIQTEQYPGWAGLNDLGIIDLNVY